MLCMLTTDYLLIAAIPPAPLPVLQESALSHSEFIQKSDCTPVLQLSPMPHPFQQITGMELLDIFPAFRSCLPSAKTEDCQEDWAKLLTEVHIVKTKGKLKPETSQRGIRKKFCPLGQSSIGCSEKLRNLHPQTFFPRPNLMWPWATLPEFSFDPTLSRRLHQINF